MPQFGVPMATVVMWTKVQARPTAIHLAPLIMADVQMTRSVH